MSVRCYLTFAVFVFICPSNLFGQNATVKGYVTDTKKQPLEGVNVALYATGAGGSIDSTKTDDKGYYEIKKKSTSTYDVIFTHSKMEVAVVELLAEDQSQSISIKMFLRGEKRTAMEYHGNLQAAERFMVQAAAAKPEDLKLFRDLYKDSGIDILIRDEKIPIFAMEAPAAVRTLIISKRESLVKLHSMIRFDPK